MIPLRWSIVLAALAALTAAFALRLHGAALNYDIQWALDWGRGLLHGHAPEYAAVSAPTSHPLATLLSALAQLVAGNGAPGVLHWLAYVMAAVLVLACARVGYELGRWPGAVAAAVVIAISAPVELTSAVAFQDVTTAALVMLALLLATTATRRPALPLIPLAFAGLIRPEIWALAFAWWLWSARGGGPRVWLRLGLLALAAPLLWGLHDLLVSGDPLLSFTHTRTGAAAAHRTTGLAEGPRELIANLRAGLGTPVVAGAVVGAALLLREARRRRDQVLLVPVGAAVLLGGAFLVLAAGKLSLLERYVIPLMAIFAALFGYALGGWLRERAGRVRTVWAAGAVVLAAASIYTAPRQQTRVSDTMSAARAEQGALTALKPLAGAAAGCRQTAVYNYRTRPYLAYDLGRRPAQIAATTTPQNLGPSVAWFVPVSHRALVVHALLGRPAPVPAYTVPASFHPAVSNPDWRVFKRGC